MLDALAIANRLRALTDGAARRFADVGTALELSAVLKVGVPRLPAAYVVLLGESPSPNARSTGPSRQEVPVQFGVVLALSATNSPTADSAIDALQEHRLAVRQSLMGWTPGSGMDAIELGRSDLLRLVPGTVYWLDRFSTRYQQEALYGP